MFEYFYYQFFQDEDAIDEAKAIEQILEEPNKLKSLDLEVFNSDIYQQNVRDLSSGNKIMTLYQGNPVFKYLYYA